MTLRSLADRKNISKDDKQIKELLDEYLTHGRGYSKTLRKAKMVEATACGNNMDGLDGEVYGRDDSGIKVTRNVQDNLIQTLSSLYVKNLPSAWATTPNSNNLLNVAAARIVTKLIEFKEREEKLADKWAQVSRYAVTHGTAFMKIVWDDDKQKTVWQPLSIFDVILQNAPSLDQVKWAVISTMIDPWDAVAAIQSNPKYEDYDCLPSLQKYEDGNGTIWEGVCKQELYVLPNSRFPTGLYAVVIDDIVCESSVYPYVFMEGNISKAMLPLATMYCRVVRGSSLGRTPAFQTAGDQIMVNTLETKNAVKAIMASSLFFIHESLAQGDILASENMVVTYADDQEQHAKDANFKQTWPIDPAIAFIADGIVSKMRETFGISESTAGQAADAQSGKSLAIQAELDANKHTDALKSLWDAILYAYELDLQLEKTFRIDPKTLPVDGEDVTPFFLSTVNSPRLTLEQRSQHESATSDKLAKVKEDVANGFRAPGALAELAPTPELAAQRAYVSRLVDLFLETGTVELTQDTGPAELIMSVINQKKTDAEIAGDQEASEMLTWLASNYLNQVQGETQQEQDPTPNAGSSTPQQQGAAPLPPKVSDITVAPKNPAGPR